MNETILARHVRRTNRAQLLQVVSKRNGHVISQARGVWAS